MSIRIGFGYDVHKLKINEELYIGGVKIIHDKGSVGHSDGDVLIHAICDAMFGAANMRDIGFHFPDTSNDFKNIDSKILLRRTVKMIYDSGYKIGNIDTTIVLQRPKIKNYIPEMKRTLAKTMNIHENKISVKATTTEMLGFEGREEGISAYATLILNEK